jgi:hypothetical protein
MVRKKNIKKKKAKTKEKKKQSKKQQKKKSKKLSKKQIQNKQVMWALVLMVSVIIIIFLVPYVIKNYINKFEHIGLDFYKTKAGDLIFYTTEIPLINSYGFPIGEYKISFKNNPTELEDIKLIIPDNKIEFQKNLPVFISIQKDAPICDDNIIAVVGLTNFLDKFGNLNVKGAIHDDEVLYASGSDTLFVTCETYPKNTVIEFKTGDETKLKRINENCYEIWYKDCEINQASEKFILIIMEKYMEKYNEVMSEN